jgi:hypothetical protein
MVVQAKLLRVVLSPSVAKLRYQISLSIVSLTRAVPGGEVSEIRCRREQKNQSDRSLALVYPLAVALGGVRRGKLAASLRVTRWQK